MEELFERVQVEQNEQYEGLSEANKAYIAKQLENYQSNEGACLEPEIRYDAPNCEAVLVTGNPYEAAKDMDFQQGDNPYLAMGNCGLVSISNALRRAGIDVSENAVTSLAIENDLCYYDVNGDPTRNGGTDARDWKSILALLDVDSDIYTPYQGGALEDIATAIDTGRSVIISVNADMLYGEDTGGFGFFGPVANHAVTVTGIARDAQTGEIAGVYIADSGRWEPGDVCRYLTVEEFHDSYTDVIYAYACITEPIMGR